MNKKRGGQRESRERAALDDVMANFVPCGRCSFFLAGYRAIHGMSVLEVAAEQVDGEWLTLPWNHETRQLVHNSYGHRLDINLFYIDGRCPECHRRFVYEAGEQEGESPLFRVELKAK